MNHVARIFALSTLALAVSGTAYAQDLDQPQGFAAVTERQVYHANDRSQAPSVRTISVAQPDQGNTPLGFVAKTERDLFPGNFEQPKSSLTREQVRKEAIAANKAGEVPSGFLAMSERDTAHGAIETGSGQRNLAAN